MTLLAGSILFSDAPVSLVELLHFGLEAKTPGLQEREVVKVTRGVVERVVVSELSLDDEAGQDTVGLV